MKILKSLIISLFVATIFNGCVYITLDFDIKILTIEENQTSEKNLK